MYRGADYEQVAPPQCGRRCASGGNPCDRRHRSRGSFREPRGPGWLIDKHPEQDDTVLAQSPPHSGSIMVIAIRCPSPTCRKYMLVEGTDRGKTVHCLICKVAIPVPAK
jgi:hypothetical protein